MNTNALESLVASMPLADLARRSGRSVEEIVNWALSGNSSARSMPVARTAPSTSKPGPGRRPVSMDSGMPRRSEGGGGGGSRDVNTRTPQGRQRYAEAVLKMVEESKGPIAASEIRERLGGTPLQVRAALNRWIQEGKISYQGQARAMRYTAA